MQEHDHREAFFCSDWLPWQCQYCTVEAKSLCSNFTLTVQLDNRDHSREAVKRDKELGVLGWSRTRGTVPPVLTDTTEAIPDSSVAWQPNEFPLRESPAAISKRRRHRHMPLQCIERRAHWASPRANSGTYQQRHGVREIRPRLVPLRLRDQSSPT